jgi:hypothetical protein
MHTAESTLSSRDRQLESPLHIRALNRGCQGRNKELHRGFRFTGDGPKRVLVGRRTHFKEGLNLSRLALFGYRYRVDR